MGSTLTTAVISVGGAVIVGIAGFWASVRNTNKTVKLSEQGQVTDRYTKAIEQLGSDKLDVRIGGIYALERIADDSPRDHPTVMEVLTAFVRERSQSPRSPVGPIRPGIDPRVISPDVQAAITVLGRRNRGHDRHPLNLAGTHLSHARLTGMDLTDANLANADLADTDLSRANLTRANLDGANISRADLTGAILEGAILTRAQFNGAFLVDAKLARANFYKAILAGAANLSGSDLSGANLAETNLTSVNLARAILTGADLRDADCTDAGFYRAILKSAKLTGAHLTRANLRHADLTGADLSNALWPAGAEVPKGWQRDVRSGRLKPVGTNSTSGPTDTAPTA